MADNGLDEAHNESVTPHCGHNCIVTVYVIDQHRHTTRSHLSSKLPFKHILSNLNRNVFNPNDFL